MKDPPGTQIALNLGFVKLETSLKLLGISNLPNLSHLHAAPYLLTLGPHPLRRVVVE